MWTAHTPIAVDAEQAGDDASYDDDVTQSFALDEIADQRAALLTAAALLADVVGTTADRVQVSISGHANPAHGPGGGGVGYEMVTISVHAVARPD